MRVSEYVKMLHDQYIIYKELEHTKLGIPSAVLFFRTLFCTLFLLQPGENEWRKENKFALRHTARPIPIIRKLEHPLVYSLPQYRTRLKIPSRRHPSQIEPQQRLVGNNWICPWSFPNIRPIVWTYQWHPPPERVWGIGPLHTPHPMLSGATSTAYVVVCVSLRTFVLQEIQKNSNKRKTCFQ